jgi:hypothetical protein
MEGGECLEDKMVFQLMKGLQKYQKDEQMQL